MASPVQQEQTQARTWSRPAGFDVLRIVLGLVLLTAAVLKGWQLATEPTLEKGLLTSRWFLIVAVEVEWLLALWLLSGLYKRQAWWATLGCFALFAGIALYKALSGETSCGCFGKIHANPWYTAVLDAAVVGLLARFPWFGLDPARRRRSPEHLAYRLSCISALGFVFLAAVAGAIAMGSYRPANIDRDGLLVGDSAFVVLEPQDWTGKRCPLLKHIEIGAALEQGEWDLILYHSDCPACQAILKQYQGTTYEPSTAAGLPRVALVEVPPYGTAHPADDTPSVVFGRLKTDREWMVSTPVTLQLSEGIVRSVETAPPE
jgi:hypothetical protein